MEKNELEQAISYFRKYNVYGRLFASMREKYASLGHLGGSFVLSGLTEEERGVLSGFAGADLGSEPTVRLSFSQLKWALSKSRFGACTWEEILTAYERKPLVVKKEERTRQKEERDAFWEDCLSQCGKEDVREWLSVLLREQGPGYRLVLKQYKADRKEARKLLTGVIHAAEHLPADRGQRQFLPVFASGITGNPHSFDEGTSAGRLLLQFGKYRFGEADGQLSGIEQKESVLYQMGILRDELSNTCLAYRVTGRKKEGGVHQGIQGFYEEGQAFVLTLHTLGGLLRLEPSPDHFSRIYVLENPAVFSYLIKKYPGHTFLCTSGRLTLAGYATMDLFPSDTQFYYAGDFDPEGLQIAQGLKERYGERLVFWNYKREFYEKAVSELGLDDARLRKLDRIDCPGLQEIRQCMWDYRRAAYQENMLGAYVVEERCGSEKSFDADHMSASEIHAAIQAGVDEAEAGRVKDASGVFEDFREGHTL